MPTRAGLRFSMALGSVLSFAEQNYFTGFVAFHSYFVVTSFLASEAPFSTFLTFVGPRHFA